MNPIPIFQYAELTLKDGYVWVIEYHGLQFAEVQFIHTMHSVHGILSMSC